ncbi:D-aminoacylase [Halococcus sp. PRR34]|uniref:N-acyl-D-amino-acid deacylase family protein n=1 Tax=Halococcus sp. PRR34 TaxID=3020830 RepID=UPI00235E7294|nr:D-aminoacylase [Halococcus sp. PRR34]
MVAESIEFLNATVLDGSCGDPFKAHVQVADGRIHHIDDTPAGADRQVDLEGACLAPGFVDMHAHSELRLFDHPDAAEKLTQGVTLEVMGQDGVSVAPVPERHEDAWAKRVESLLGQKDEWEWNTVAEFLDSLDSIETGVNCAYYAPHGNIRSHVADFDDRALNGDELADVRDHLHKTIENGAFAMSKGMIYPPSSYGRDPEFVALGEVLADHDTLMVSHVWNETDHVVDSIERYIDICEQAGCQPHVSHLKVGGESNWGASEQIVATFDAATERGTTVSFDQYPYTAGSTMLTALLPPWARTGDSDQMLDRLCDELVRDRIRTDIESVEGEWDNLARAAGTWDNILLTRTRSGDHEGKTIADLADTWDVTPVDAMCDLLVDETLDVTMADFVMAEEDIERFLSDSRGTICSDGIFGGKPHPRAIGTFSRLIERYVREREVLPLDRAVNKMAGHPADILGLPDRGRVEEGYVADLVVFDPRKVRERATYESPLQLSLGMQFVLVNGQVVVEDGELTGARPGRVLRSFEEWNGNVRRDYRA